MSSQIPNYYYNQQLKRYVVQFMEIFRNLSVRTGVREDGQIREMPVSIAYGSKDRVTAAVLHKNTQNSPIRLPTMSSFIRAINLAPENRKGVGGTRRETFLPRGGMLPNDVKTVRQLMPVPYTMDIDLSIWTSNTEQQFQILEQIMMYFDPILQIQTSDEMFDWTKLSIIELTNINFDENYPIGTDRRVIVSTLTFRIPIWVTGPNELKNSFVKEVFARITAIRGDITFDEFFDSVYTAEDSEYESIVSGDELDLP